MRPAQATGNPPDAAANVSRPPYALYSPGQIVLALLVGSPLAGALLTSLNYRRLGHVPLANQMILLGVFFACVQLFAQRITSGGWVGAFVALNFWHQAHRDECLFDAHVEAGGPKASSWRAWGVSIACIVIYLLVGLGVSEASR